MIEMLGVLAIIGVLSAGGIMGYSIAMENYHVNKFISDSELVAAGLKDLKGEGSVNVGSSSLCKSVMPKEWGCTLWTNDIRPFGSFNLVWYGRNSDYLGWTTSVKARNGNGEYVKIKAPLSFIYFNNLIGASKDFSVNSCVKLLTHKWTDLIAMIHNYGGGIPAGQYSEMILPLTIAEAELRCKTTLESVRSGGGARIALHLFMNGSMEIYTP